MIDGGRVKKDTGREEMDGGREKGEKKKSLSH